MTTIYTVNNKVLKNAATDKWLTKKEGPDTFKLTYNNAESIGSDMGPSYSGGCWKSPNYPNGWQGNGHKLKLTVHNNIKLSNIGGMNGYYLKSVSLVSAGPTMVQASSIKGNVLAGTYEYDIMDNSDETYGAYINIFVHVTTDTETGYISIDNMQTFLNNVTIEII